MSPLFDFKCPNCEEQIKDVVILINRDDIDERVKDGKVICPKCSIECQKMVSMSTTFRLSGDGWTPKFGPIR